MKMWKKVKQGNEIINQYSTEIMDSNTTTINEKYGETGGTSVIIQGITSTRFIFLIICNNINDS